ncbi:hypothetical protein EDB92DRAFT_1852268 [Lactarius akahatsu]|uniref:Uncharacterized protein n=1 Tax=Lactarius akahatsu TaxID=416441 RepID=A0AAD4QC12_9AGAM|nr:hypothetical protein EDB92DRAFT_1852268 [Lactarius akahatsu]
MFLLFHSNKIALPTQTRKYALMIQIFGGAVHLVVVRVRTRLLNLPIRHVRIPNVMPRAAHPKQVPGDESFAQVALVKGKPLRTIVAATALLEIPSAEVVVNPPDHERPVCRVSIARCEVADLVEGFRVQLSLHKKNGDRVHGDCCTGVEGDSMIVVALDADVSGLVHDGAAIKYSRAYRLEQTWTQGRTSTARTVRISEGNKRLFDASCNLFDTPIADTYASPNPRA